MNRDLPIFPFREKILSAMEEHGVVVVTAETGAGKSTQVPQFLLEAGYDLVVTEPRRLAARTVAQRVAEERGECLGITVGYRTAVDRQDSPATRCLFCTDGLALVRELMGQNRGVLILDEVHEWNENMEVLIAWARLQKRQGADFKLVVMSATMEAEKMSVFFDNAPVISVPGRLFPVEEQEPKARLEDDIAELVRQGRNVLVFQPGKAEIAETIAQLEQIQVPAKILPLHGQLTPQEQAECFKHYSQPKVVVSTNVAQTSVTIDDIDAVVDSGMERRIELVDGVEGLYLRPISWADATQRRGRAGRTKSGIYVDHCGASNRPDFPVAEIMRKRLDQTVLRLAIAGFDMEELEFFHQPEMSDIRDAKRALRALGCMTEDGEVTPIGRLVNRFPVSVQYARMIVEADRLGVVDDILTVAAILEQDGITIPPPSRNRPDRPDWRRLVPGEHDSDIMAQLKVWNLARLMNDEQMKESGISIRAYYRAKEVRSRLADVIKRYARFGSSGDRQDIIKAVCAGMVDHLYHGEYGTYRNGDDTSRELSNNSTVSGGEWLVGLPFDLEIETRRGRMTLNLIEMATRVEPDWLIEVAPQLQKIEEGIDPFWNSEDESCYSTRRRFFNGQLIAEEKVATPDHSEAPHLRAEWLTRNEGQRIARCWRERRESLEYNSWISDPEDVLPHLEKLLSAVEITRDNGGLGEPIYGYFSLHSDSDPDFKIKIRETREEAEKETRIGLERLLKKSTKLSVPRDEPWQTNGWGSSLTQLGKNLKSKINEMITQSLKSLTADNFAGEVERLKAEAEKVKVELGRGYFDARENLDSTKKESEKVLESIDKTLVEKEVEEIERQIRNAKDSLSRGNYEEVYSISSEINSNLQSLFQMGISRQEVRASAHEGYQKLVERLGENNHHVNKVKDLIFSSDNRDYQKAIDEIKNLKDLVTAEGEMALTFEQGKNLRIFSLRGDDCQEGLRLKDGELRVYNGYDNVLMARSLDDGVEKYFSAQVGEDLEGRIVLRNSDEEIDPNHCLVFVHEYSPGSGAKRWPSFYVTWGSETCLLSECSRTKYSGSDTYSLVIAPMGWAENIASQFVDERDYGSQEIAYNPDFNQIRVISENGKESISYDVGNDVMRAAFEKAKNKEKRR